MTRTDAVANNDRYWSMLQGMTPVPFFASFDVSDEATPATHLAFSRVSAVVYVCVFRLFDGGGHAANFNAKADDVVASGVSAKVAASLQSVYGITGARYQELVAQAVPLLPS